MWLIMPLYRAAIMYIHVCPSQLILTCTSPAVSVTLLCMQVRALQRFEQQLAGCRMNPNELYACLKLPPYLCTLACCPYSLPCRSVPCSASSSSSQAAA